MSGSSFYFSYIFLAVAPWPCWQVKLHWLITWPGCVGITVVHPARGPWERHAVSFCQQLVLWECSTFCMCVFVCVVPYFTLRRPLPKSTDQLPPSSFLASETYHSTALMRWSWTLSSTSSLLKTSQLWTCLFQDPTITSAPHKSPWQSDVSPMTHHVVAWIPRALCQPVFDSWK